MRACLIHLLYMLAIFVGVSFVPSVSLSQGRDTRDSGTLSRQWDSLDEPFFCDWSQVEVVYQAVDLW